MFYEHWGLVYLVLCCSDLRSRLPEEKESSIDVGWVIFFPVVKFTCYYEFNRSPDHVYATQPHKVLDGWF
jgi:hypothetical protein